MLLTIRSHPPDRLVRVPDEQRNDRSIPRHKASVGSGQNHTRREHTPTMSAQAELRVRGLARVLLTVVEVFGFGWRDAAGVVVVEASAVEASDHQGLEARIGAASLPGSVGCSLRRLWGCSGHRRHRTPIGS